ncbi:MAG: hypothetical protein AAB364_01160 [Patescibacteria group bacterium]
MDSGRRRELIIRLADLFGRPVEYIEKALRVHLLEIELREATTAECCERIISTYVNSDFWREYLAIRRAMEILEAEEAGKGSVLADDPFHGNAPVGG